MQRGEDAGIPVHEVTERDMWRMAWPGSEEPPTVLTLVGRYPEAQNLDELDGPRRVAPLPDGVSYAGNMGFSVRTAEVAGATGVILATPAPIPGRAWKDLRHSSMQATRFIPVVESPIEEVIACQSRGHRIVVIETSAMHDCRTWN